MLTAVFVSLYASENSVAAQTWSLTKEQRKSYLYYYAPVILKRGDENDGKEGRDWITNYDFDRDGNFSNNRVNWKNIGQYLNAARFGQGAYGNWRIRPTLYSSAIEFMEGGSKSLVLIYHVYNAADKDGDQIHDWERVEIILRGVGGTPGSSSEYVSSATVTLHKEHHIRRYYDNPGLNFMQTATGRHLLLWQADESNFDFPPGAHGHELHFVKNAYSWIAGQVSSSASAEVNISSADSKKNVHYVFVPEEATSAVETWNAKPITYSTASGLASRVDNGNTIPWYQVKRLTYELQDLADIIPTHWQNSAWYIHWLSDDYSDILLESPVINEAGQAEVSTGLQRFYARSRDSGKSDLTDGREGITSKNWLYGAYSAETDPETPSGSDDFKGFEGLGTDSYGYSRGAASGYYNSHNSFWWQHDFFVHSGVVNSSDTREEGIWLRDAWYSAANGGFDGRWVQLFDDRPTYEAPTPLTLNITYPANLCTETFRVSAVVTGGQSPYYFTWSNADPISPPTATNNTAFVYAYVTATVTVQAGNGETRTANVYLEPSCGPGENIP